jgi:hypothetical protein
MVFKVLEYLFPMLCKHKFFICFVAEPMGDLCQLDAEAQSHRLYCI